MAHDPDTSFLPLPLSRLVDAALHRDDPAARPTAHALLAGLLGLAEDTGAGALLSAGADAASAVHADAGDLTVGRGLAERAEAAHQSLSSPARTRAREVLLRFVVAGKAADCSQDNFRTAGEEEFTTDRSAEEQEVLEEVLAAFTAEGILVRTGTCIRPASLALGHAWPRMRNWLIDDREGLRHLRALGEASAAWERGGRRTDSLLRGDALREHADAYADAPAHLRPTPAERRFLAVSQHAEAQRATRRRRLFTLVSVLVVLFLVAGGLAFYQTRISRARAEQDAARTAAAIAENVRTSDPETAMLLSAASWQIADSDDTRAALYNSLNHGIRQVTDNPVLVPDTRPALGVRDQLLPGGRLATVVEGGAAQVWDLDTQMRVGHVPLAANRGQNASAVRFAEDGSRIVAPQGEGRGARALSLTGGTPRLGPLLAKGQTAGVNNVSRDARRAALSWLEGDGFRQSVVDTGTGRTLWSRLVEYEAEPVLSPDGESVAVCTTKKAAVLVDLRTGDERRLIGRSDGVPTSMECDAETQLVFSGDGRYLLSSLDGLSGMLWNTRSAIEVDTIDLPVEEVPYRWAVNESGTLVAASISGRILVWQRHGEALLLAARFPTANLDPGSQGEAPVWELSFDGDRHLRFIENDRRIRSVDLSWLARERDGEEGRRAVFAPHAQAVLHYSFDKEALELTTSGHRRQLKTAGSPFLSLMDTVVGAFSPDGTLYAHIVDDGERRPSLLQVWSARTGRPNGPLIDLRGEDEPEAISFFPDGRRIAVSRLDAAAVTQRTIEVWDLTTSHRTAVFRDAGAAELALSPDGTLLVTAAGDRIDFTSKKVRRQALGPAGARDVAFSEDGQTLAVSTDRGSIDLWDATATRRIGAIPSMGSTDSPVTSLRFSPDGQLLAGVDDTGVRLWDVPDRRRLGGPLRLAGGGHISVAFDTSGKLHVASTLNRHLTIDLDPESIINDICRSVGRDLTAEEWEQYLPNRARHPVC
ncbi:WD40 repeat domain-containing protein [Streptomyces scabiei]|uniref:WD40 repeat domain-containing protein n=1 Tax=Streptomyces scabiei TaxID=1930 RepID=UPI00056A5E55|nr:WD40 repeat domain-containing protein [Streptomyces scabiei]